MMSQNLQNLQSSQNCYTCAQLSTDVTQAILKLEAKIRTSALILVIFGTVALALVAIIAYLLKSLWELYSTWRAMVKKSTTVVASLDMFKDMPNVGASADNEIYASDTDLNLRTPTIGEKINVGMTRLEKTYSDYNKQIAAYSVDVLKKPADDAIDRRVLDRTNDDLV